MTTKTEPGLPPQLVQGGSAMVLSDGYVYSAERTMTLESTRPSKSGRMYPTFGNFMGRSYP